MEQTEEKIFEERREKAILASESQNGHLDLIKEVKISLLNKCIDLLYHNKSLSFENYTFLKDTEDKDMIFLGMKSITRHEINEFGLEFDGKRVEILNLTSEVKYKIYETILGKKIDMRERKEVCFTCLNILLKKNNIVKDDYLFLKDFAEKDLLRVTKLMIIISEPSIKNLSSILDNRTVNFNNISKETKREITKLGLKTKKQIIPNENYLAVAENKATNTIIKVLASKHKEHEFDFIGNLEIKMDKALIKLQGIKTTKTSTSKFLDFLMMMWVENGRTDNTIKIHLSEYLKLRGKEDNKNTRKEIRKEINEALNTIENIRITFISERGKEKLNVKLNGGTSGIVRGVIFFNFNKDFIEYLNEIPNQFMYVPNELFKFNDKYNPHSYYLLRKACLHKRMNKLKENENIISITSLLNCCPKFETYKNYTGSNMKQLTERIITPFERDMDIIESFKWNYKNKIPMTFNELQKENIILKWNKYPDKEVDTYKKLSKK